MYSSSPNAARRRANDEATEVLKEYRRNPGEASALKALFDLAVARKDWPEARDYLKRVHAGAETKDYHVKLAAIHELEGDFDRAYFELALAYQQDTADGQLVEKMNGGSKAEQVGASEPLGAVGKAGARRVSDRRRSIPQAWDERRFPYRRHLTWSLFQWHAPCLRWH
jgi:hypothetical protein